ncbi:ribonuclease 3-like protein 2 isoform X1 [Humulus lupulus]|uniref:ribonuclease 3-like protein 2 isoform X1 n=1 Tax=Humulus lupulus TaxID=3486 RepID=UPI002B405644|nr:ribonuclease 3-like protein 2 isoform X1 [Humulus lupulus]
MNSMDPALFYVGTTTTTTTATTHGSVKSCVEHRHAPVPPNWRPLTDDVAAIGAVERIVGYCFKNKRLLEDALTHSSVMDSTASYQRLEFLGDATLGLAVSNYVFLAYPGIDPGHLSLLRAANVSTEKLARVAVRHGLYRFVRRNAPALDEKIREFSEAVSNEEDAVAHGGSIKAPKVLADIVESIAAAVYVDVNFDLQKLWVIFRGLLEPMVTLEDLLQQPQPVTMLFELCQKHGKQVDIRHWRDESKNVASVYVDGKFVASGSSEHKEISKLNAAKLALCKLSKSMPNNDGLSQIMDGIRESFEIEGAKQKLHELCGKKKWPKPTFRMEKEEGPAHERTFVSSVQISTVNGVLFMMGDGKSRVRDAENSAASLMIRALQESEIL